MRLLYILRLLLVVLCSARAESHDEPAKSIKIFRHAFKTVPELIKLNDYPVEIHHVTTEDGYILEMHRIPSGKAEGAGPAANKSMVFIQHGLLSSTADWVIAGPELGLGYLLADRGYDVWMGNVRGNMYSRQHKKLNPNQAKFWDFSWHEIGVYDLPAMIDYALQHSDQVKTFYIGHSQGTTAFYVMCSERPEYNSKIRAQFSMAPIAYMNNLYSPLFKSIALFTGPLGKLMNFIGMNEFLPRNDFLVKLGGTICDKASKSCSNMMFVMCGFNPDGMNMELLPIIMQHYPAGAATKQLLHYGQLIQKKPNQFCKYDYGFFENMIKYGQKTPPEYNLHNVTAPVALFYSLNDWLAAEIDVQKLYENLSNGIGIHQVADEKFNHLDFVWGKYADKYVYQKIFDIMSEY